MFASSPELWWAVVASTIVFLILGVGIVIIIVQNQRRHISAQREKMAVLRKSEQEYSDLFNNVSDVVFVHSLDGNILRINDALTTLLGFNKKDLIGKSFSEIFDKKYEDKINEYLNEIKQTGESRGLIHLNSKENQEFVFEYRNSLVTQNGHSIAVRGVARNVTEQKKAEKALRESEERFRRLIKYSPVPIAVHSIGRWVYLNDAAKTLAGAAHIDEVIGKSVLSFIKPERRKAVKKRIKETLLQGNKVSIIEETIVRLDGKQIEVELVAIPIVYRSKPAVQMVIRDITEQKRVQEELARAQRLETAGRIAGQIAHDFNNLLAPLTAYPTLIHDDLAKGSDVSEFLSEMESAATKIAEINQQLLALGRRGHYTTEQIDLNQLISKLTILKTLPKDLILNLELTNDLFLIKGGAAQLTRVLMNLIINAKEAMNDLGALTIKTENVYLDEPLKGNQTIKRGEYVKVEICDTGTGIDATIVNKIFDPFFTTKKMDKLRGSGLGLSIVHGVVEDHNGYITFTSEQGQGTSFFLYFPISRETPAESVVKNGIPKGRGEHILFVDDDPVQRTVSSQLLKRLGYQVQVVSSGEEAVEYVRKHIPDLVILDMVMDGIDGAETYRQIIEFKSGLRAIVLSGYAMSHRVDEALRLGAGAFVPKPIRPHLLATVIRKELDKEIPSKN